MRLDDDRLWLSPTDLATHLECRHATTLAAAAARDGGPPSLPGGAYARLLARKGRDHEREYLASLHDAGRSVEVIDVDGGGVADAVTPTEMAMAAGADVVYQGALESDGWRGRADFIERVARPTDLGDWGYEAVDTKLSRTAALPHHALQLLVYSQAIGRIQGTEPEAMHVELGSGRRETIRVADVAAYARRAQASLARAVGHPAATEPYPCPHCDVCGFRATCEGVWRERDHLSAVAGIRRAQVDLLRAAGVETLEGLAGMDPAGGVAGLRRGTLDALRDQARLQAASRASGETAVEPRAAPEDRGLARLPAPSDGDVFLDLEGDPFWQPARELTFLFGIVTRDGGAWRYRAFWGHDPEEEREALAALTDALATARRAHPAMHVYHYSPAETSALPRMAASHGVREDEVDELLRAGAFVDLYPVVRQAFVVGDPSYGLKTVERLAGFTRSARLRSGADAVLAYERWREDGDPAELEAIAAYNEEDCRATLALRDWLVAQRPSDMAWWAPEPAQIREETRRTLVRRAALRDALVAGEPEGSPRRLAGELLDYHRREARPGWWRWYALLDMDEEGLVADGEAVGAIEPTGGPPVAHKRSLLYEMRFPEQEHKIGPPRADDPATGRAVSVHAVDGLRRTLTIGRSRERAGEPPPRALIPGTPFNTDAQQAALERLAASVRDGTGRYPHLEGILARERPRVAGVPDGSAIQSLDLDGQLALARGLERSHLVVQGPPGTGKTWLAGRMAAALVRDGRRVGLTAFSHKAVNNLIAQVLAAADEMGVDLRIARKCSADGGDGRYEGDDRVANLTTNAACLASGDPVLAGTSWLFADAAADGALDHLLVDEAGQLALADALAGGTAARNLILVGDPLQLPHVSQALHPPGSSASVMEHLLDGRATVAPDRGVFLAVTRRLHPSVCGFVSRAIYEGRLEPHPDCALRGTGGGTGIRFLPVEHRDRGSRSPEEADAVRREVARLGGLGVPAGDVMVVAPYNAHVRELRSVLPGDVRVGTVDRFQGQEAPVVFFSMATSSGEELPRGVGFTFSRNRLNVAISRAQCLAYLVCSPALLEARARDVEEMRLVSTLCALVEEAGLQTGAAV